MCCSRLNKPMTGASQSLQLPAETPYETVTATSTSGLENGPCKALTRPAPMRSATAGVRW